MKVGQNYGLWLARSPRTMWSLGNNRSTFYCLLAIAGLTVFMALTAPAWWGPSVHVTRVWANVSLDGVTGGDIFVPTLSVDAWEEVLKTSSLYMSEIPAAPHGAENQSYKRTHGVAPMKCEPGATVSETLNMKPLSFLQEFKNPCWRETLSRPILDLYAKNNYAKHSPTYQKTFNRIRDQWNLLQPAPTSRLRCLPYFFLAGQPKCGSTDFFKRLTAHPDIVTPPTKESHWWGKVRYGLTVNSTDPVPFSDYVDLYDGVAMDIERGVASPPSDVIHPKITGDASVSTLWSNDDWWRNAENCGLLAPKFTNAHHVHAVVPQARIIVILRNPIDRLYSDFLYFHRLEKSPKNFHQAVEEGIRLFTECQDNQGMRACLYNSSLAGKITVRLRVGLYFQYLQEWLSLYPRSQVAVVRLEDYSARPLSTIRQILKFLELREMSEVEDDKVLEQPKLNTRRTVDRKLGGMLNKTRTLLHSFYHPHNVQLSKLLKDDRFLWADCN
ncbi:Carbohydrate sulfotransferase 15 [Bulinus truncatus]|nr:Carbohydrate sulfotransferase 15 [Bulinus truncatus]